MINIKMDGRMVVTCKQSNKGDDETILYRPTIVENICQRCLSKIKKHWRLPNNIRYCWNCAAYGRIDENKWLMCHIETHTFEAPPECFYTWNGTLTPLQTNVANKILEGLKKRQDQLLYAVTGAGKTEMLFPCIKWALEAGKRIAYVSPRVDVIREIAPRIMANFKIRYTIMHGEIKEQCDYTQLIFATIHQLYKFYHAFDLIIVDEADAFPLNGNQSLWYALAQARSDRSTLLYMTATLSQDLKRLIRFEQVEVQNLLQRFHGYRLPNIQISVVGKCWKKALPFDIRQQFEQQKNPWIIFVPMIDDLESIKNKIEQLHLNLKVACVSSETSNREELIKKLKNGKIDILCTTIILERGITISNVQIIILDADKGKYSDETLLQIAGRSGRDVHFPKGKIIVYCQENTKQLNRIREIINGINREPNM